MDLENENCFKITDLADFLYQQYQGIPRGIIFDCDGVLVDSVEANLKFYNKLRNALDLPDLTEEQRDYCQMATVEQSFNHIIPKALHSQLPIIMKDFSYLTDIEPLITVSENLIPFLEKYKPICKMGVHTNRMGNINPMLERLGIGNMFDPIITVQRAEAKPSPDGTLQILKEWKLEASDVLFIGDSSADLGAALGAKVPFLSYKNIKLLEPHNATCCDFDDLSKAFSLVL